MVSIGARRPLIYGCALKVEAVSRSMTAQALAFGWCIFRNSIQVRTRVGRSDMGPFLGPAARTPLAAHATNHPARGGREHREQAGGTNRTHPKGGQADRQTRHQPPMPAAFVGVSGTRLAWRRMVQRLGQRAADRACRSTRLNEPCTMSDGLGGCVLTAIG